MELPSDVASMVPKARTRGTIVECVAAHMSLEVTMRYQYRIGGVFRQQYTNSSSCIPLHDLEELIESGEDGGVGCESAYFVSNQTITAKLVHEWALHLAPYYQNEFKVLLGSKEAYEAEMKNLKSEDYTSPILVTVLARVFLCPIILYLPDDSKPFYFYPYPVKNGKAYPQFGDYSRPPMRLTYWSNGQYSLLMPIGYDEEYLDTSSSPLLNDVDGGNDEGEDDGEGEDEDEEGQDEDEKEDGGNSKKKYQVSVSVSHLFSYKKGDPHYVETESGAPYRWPKVSLYNGCDKKTADAAGEWVDTLRERIKMKFPKEKGIVYNISDINKFAEKEGVSTCSVLQCDLKRIVIAG